MSQSNSEEDDLRTLSVDVVNDMREELERLRKIEAAAKAVFAPDADAYYEPPREALDVLWLALNPDTGSSSS